MSGLAQHLDEYLQLRRTLGHKLADAHRLLPRFVAYLDERSVIRQSVCNYCRAITQTVDHTASPGVGPAPPLRSEVAQGLDPPIGP
jgi:hypothetical protein